MIEDLHPKVKYQLNVCLTALLDHGQNVRTQIQTYNLNIYRIFLQLSEIKNVVSLTFVFKINEF